MSETESAPRQKVTVAYGKNYEADIYEGDEIECRLDDETGRLHVIVKEGGRLTREAVYVNGQWNSYRRVIREAAPADVA